MTFNHVIPSDFDAAREVQKSILDAVQDAGYEEGDYFGIKLALEETLINAIKHGNKFDKNKNVTIRGSVTPKKVELCIEDEGKGFERQGVPDPTADENLTKSSGRGILLMEAYMDKVEYTKCGRCCRLVKTRK